VRGIAYARLLELPATRLTNWYLQDSTCGMENWDEVIVLARRRACPLLSCDPYLLAEAKPLLSPSPAYGRVGERARPLWVRHGRGYCRLRSGSRQHQRRPVGVVFRSIIEAREPSLKLVPPEASRTWMISCADRLQQMRHLAVIGGIDLPLTVT
jgi:hypothetical protein